MMGRIAGLISIVESCRKASISPSERKAFYVKRGWVENRMIFLRADSSVDQFRAYEYCVYLAASLYRHTVPRPLCTWSGVHVTIVEKPRSALLRADIDTFWQPHADLLLWVLVTAAPACLEGPRKLWFFGMIKRPSKTCFPDWKAIEIKDSLRKSPWQERICSPVCERVLKRLN
jgi:hypothetical protein